MKTAKEIAAIAQLQLKAAAAVEAAEEELKRKKEAWRQIAQVELPEAMREAEITTFTLDNGFKIKLDDDVTASITEANHEMAMHWLKENGFGGLIKTQVIVSFPKHDQRMAIDHYVDVVERFGEEWCNMKENVHTSTLKAWLREQLEKARAEKELTLRL